MPNPKRKHSRSRTLSKRTHQGVAVPASSRCPKCGNVKRPHTVCPQCGTYKEREIFPAKS